jgi:hypothetical protein
MKKAFAACTLSVWIVAAQAQGTSAPPPPAIHSPGQTPITAQPPQRGNIAPIVDIRIQGEGISLPKGVGDASPPEKPAEKTQEKPAAK